MGSVRGEVAKLRYKPSSFIDLYLNKERVKSQYVANLGSIAEFVRHSSAGGKATLGVKAALPGALELGLGVEGGGESVVNITYDLENSVAQVLVLQAWLEETGRIRHIPGNAATGDYVMATGTGCFTRPRDYPAGYSWAQLHESFCVNSDKEPLRSLEQRRMLQEFSSKSGEYELLTLYGDDGVVAASILDTAFVGGFYSTYASFHPYLSVFGLPEPSVAGIQLISAVSVIHLPGNSGG